MNAYFDKFFVKHQCGFCKCYNAQYCLLVIIEKMKEAHNLLIAKLHVFGFDYKSLRAMYAYLNNRVQVTKIGFYYSEILRISFGVRQGSILASL